MINNSKNFNDRCNNLLQEIKDELKNKEKKYNEYFRNYNNKFDLLYDEYLEIILDSETLKEIRFHMEKLLEKMNKFGEDNLMYSYISDVKPLIKLELDKIILNDLHLIYEEKEIKYMLNSLDNYKKLCIEKFVDNFIKNLI